MTLRTRITACTAVLSLLLVSACADPSSEGFSAEDSSAGPSAPESTDSASTEDDDGDQDEAAAQEQLREEALQEYDAALAGPGEQHREHAAELVEQMSREEQAGQVIIGEYSGTDAAEGAELLEQLHLGGMIVMGHNVPGGSDAVDTDQLSADLETLSAAGGDQRQTPVLLSVDQEGGLVTRVGSPLTQWPTPMAYGAVYAADAEHGRQLVRSGHHRLGADLGELGFTVSFAPAGDATIGASDPVIGSRSFGDEAESVSDLAIQGIRGLASAGIIGSIKHFPGHGSVTEDSHHALPVQESSLEQLRSRDWLPFQEAADAGVPAIMMGHIEVPALEEGVPSSLSAAAYDQLREMDFDGVVVTDALNMGAIANEYGSDEAPVLALEAGADLLLMPASASGARDAVLAAVDEGRVDAQRLQEAAERVVALVLWQQELAAGELAAGPGSQLDDVLEDAPANEQEERPGYAVDHEASEQESAELAAELAEASTTLVEGTCGAELITDALQISGGTEEDRALLAQVAQEAGLQIGSGPTVTLLGGLTPASGDVVVSLDRPDALAESTAETKVALYGRTAESFEELIAVLTGEEPNGALPVPVGEHSTGDSVC